MSGKSLVSAESLIHSSELHAVIFCPSSTLDYTVLPSVFPGTRNQYLTVQSASEHLGDVLGVGSVPLELTFKN